MSTLKNKSRVGLSPRSHLYISGKPVCVCNDGFLNPLLSRRRSCQPTSARHTDTGGPSNYALVYGALREPFSFFYRYVYNARLDFPLSILSSTTNCFCYVSQERCNASNHRQNPRSSISPHPCEKKQSPLALLFFLDDCAKRCGHWTGIRCR